MYAATPCEVFIVKPECLAGNSIKTNEKFTGTWLSITLTEGKYHQVRKMITAVRHRCKRLVRVSLDRTPDWGILLPGCVKEIEEKEFFSEGKNSMFPNCDASPFCPQLASKATQCESFRYGRWDTDHGGIINSWQNNGIMNPLSSMVGVPPAISRRSLFS